MISEQLAVCKYATVSSVENKEHLKGKPEGLNTVNMLKLASKELGIGPADTMHCAEKLYLGGFITYPRTESTSFPHNFNFLGVTTCLAQLNSNQVIF
jgi:DNA topoisomerase-3